MTKSPLNDTMESTNHLLEENLENLKNEMLSKGQSIADETDMIADELIKDTEDVIRDAETGMVDLKNDAVESVEKMNDEIMEKLSLKSPAHSIDTIQQSMPDPEIERILNGDDNPFSPQNGDGNPFSSDDKVDEVDNVHTEEKLHTEESNGEPKAEETPASETQQKKDEDDLVVEDIKDE